MLRELQKSLKLFSQLVTLIKKHQEESLSGIKREDKHYSDKKLREKGQKATESIQE